MLDALKAGRIAGAGLDVYCQEPVAHSDHALSERYAMNNVILMPHLTFYTHESISFQGERCVLLPRFTDLDKKAHNLPEIGQIC